MDISEIGDFSEFAQRFGADWQRIAGASEAATIFQTWEWTSAWWMHHRTGKRFYGLVFQDRDGAVVGLAALMKSAFISPLRTLRFVGNGGSDYLDLIAQPECEAAVSAAWQAWMAEHRRSWDWVDLQQIRPGAVAERLREAPRGGGVRIAEWLGETCPYLSLPSEWEAFRRGLGKKLRQNVGYYARALEKAYVVEIRTAAKETLTDDLEAFFDLHQRRWNQRWMPGAFASRRERAFHADVAGRLLQGDMLRLHILLLDGEAQAALYCFQKDRRCYYYLGGFEPELSRLSIGTVLTAHAIRYAIEHDHATEFDLLRGDEAYKYKWGARDRHNHRLSLTHSGVRPALLAACGRISLSVEQRLKHAMHRRHAGAGAATTARSASDA